jgi:hypothetical protein
MLRTYSYPDPHYEWWMNIYIGEYYTENGGWIFLLVSTIQRMVDKHLDYTENGG